MTDTPIDSFLVEIGFQKPTGAREAREAVGKVEAGITADASAEADKRETRERASTGRRATTAQQLARLLTAMEQERAGRVEKIRKDEQADADKRDAEALKRATERRDALVKSTRGIIVTMAALPLAIGAGITAAATGLLWATDRAAKGFERLYYVAANSGTSAAGLTKFEYAASRLGTTAEDARASVAAFGENVKTIPALEGMLKNMGIRTREANGELRDTSELTKEYIDHLKALPQLQREARASVWGISNATTRAVVRPEFAGYEAEQDRINKIIGADPNAAAAGGAAFESAMKRVEAILGALGTRVETNLFEVIRPRIDAVAQWVLDHGDTITNFVNTTAKGLTDLATAFANSDVVRDSLTGLGGGLERAAKYVASEEFRRDIQTFVDDVKSLAHAIRSALEFIGVLPDRSGTPSKALVNGGHPDVQPQDNDLGLPGTGDRASDTAAVSARADALAKGTEEAASGFWGWMKAKAKDLGWGDRLHDDNRVRDAILSTAADTKKLAEAANAPGGGVGGADGGGGGGGVMGRVRRTLGWAATAGGDHTHVPGTGARGDLSKNSYATKENADAIRAAAKELGTTPEDLATVIGYETGGTFSPKKWGGAGGRYMGLIQFGPNERAQYGANENQTFKEQMGAVVRYLKGRGFKPGMGMLDLYSTINAGSPGHYSASDGHGTVSSHVSRMQGGTAALARAFLARGGPETVIPALPTTPVPSGTPAKAITDAEVFAARQRLAAGGHDPKDIAIRDRYLKEQNTPLKVDLTDDSAAKITKASKSATIEEHNAKVKALDARAAEAHQHFLNMQTVLRARHGHVLPLIHPHAHAGMFAVPPSGITSSLYHSYDNSRRRGDTNITHNPTFNITSADPRQSLETARMVADRGTKDLVRNMRAVEQ